MQNDRGLINFANVLSVNYKFGPHLICKKVVPRASTADRALSMLPKCTHAMGQVLGKHNPSIPFLMFSDMSMRIGCHECRGSLFISKFNCTDVQERPSSLHYIINIIATMKCQPWQRWSLAVDADMSIGRLLRVAACGSFSWDDFSRL